MAKETTQVAPKPVNVDEEIGRLSASFHAINKMEPEERRAAFLWLKNRFAKEWPYGE